MSSLKRRGRKSTPAAAIEREARFESSKGWTHRVWMGALGAAASAATTMTIIILTGDTALMRERNKRAHQPVFPSPRKIVNRPSDSSSTPVAASVATTYAASIAPFEPRVR